MSHDLEGRWYPRAERNGSWNCIVVTGAATPDVRTPDGRRALRTEVVATGFASYQAARTRCDAENARRGEGAPR